MKIHSYLMGLSNKAMKNQKHCHYKERLVRHGPIFDIPSGGIPAFGGSDDESHTSDAGDFEIRPLAKPSPKGTS
jgi:hypothetical protein